MKTPTSILLRVVLGLTLAACGGATPAADEPTSALGSPSASEEPAPAEEAPREPPAEAHAENTCGLGFNRRWEPYEEIQGGAADLPDFLRLNRELYPTICMEHTDVRFRMLEKIAQYRDGAAVELVVGELDDPSQQIRAQAATALAAIGAPAAPSAVARLEALLPTFTDERTTNAFREALESLRQASNIGAQ